MEVVRGLADEELVAIIRESPAGSPPSDAFWELWSRHEKWLRQQAAKLAPMAPRGASRDLFVEGVLDRVRENLMRGLRLFAGRGAIRAFLRTAVRYAAIDEYWHQKARQVGKELRPGVLPGGPGTLDELLAVLPNWQPPAVFPAPDNYTENRERTEKVRAALERLAQGPGRGGVSGLNLALALRRYYVDQKTHPEIAAEFGVVERTIYRWLDAGREEIRRLLDELFRVRDLGDL